MADLSFLPRRSVPLRGRGGSHPQVWHYRSQLTVTLTCSSLLSMMTWSESRLIVNQIKTHPFFYGVDWNSLRYIDPPLVPRLQSITDTSYFPTDDLEGMPDQLEAVEGVGADQDLAFLGWVFAVAWVVYGDDTDARSLDSRSSGSQVVRRRLDDVLHGTFPRVQIGSIIVQHPLIATD